MPQKCDRKREGGRERNAEVKRRVWERGRDKEKVKKKKEERRGQKRAGEGKALSKNQATKLG